MNTEPGGSCCGGGSQPAATTTKSDPVCGMQVASDAELRCRHAGETYVFCGASCLQRFEADPASFLEPQSAEPPAPGLAEAPHTCPMHPEVKQRGPGSCPQCGMALEPVEVTSEDPFRPEFLEMRWRFLLAAGLSLPVVALAMGDMLPGQPVSQLIEPRTNTWLQLALSAPVVACAGWPLLARAWSSIVARAFNMFTLVGVGVLAAWGFSAFATAFPAALGPAFQGPDGTVAVYFESAAVIVALVLLGQVLELSARSRTGQALRALLDLAPPTALRVGAAGEGGDESVPLEEVRAGDVLRVRPGEQVPVDGVVLEGQGRVDEALVTGEAGAQVRSPGDAVIGATVNTSGSFTMRAERVGRDTLLARIVALVGEAQRSRAPIQNLADRVAAIFVPIVFAIATLSFAAWALLGPEPALAHAWVAAVSVLIIACPCALGLATPMSITVGTAAGARAGVLIKSADALQTLETIDVLVVDKTGTLTEGRPQLTTLEPQPGFEEDQLLALVAAVERSSEHPIATALVQAAETRGLTPPSATDFDNHEGLGVEAQVAGVLTLVGNALLLEGRGVPVAPLLERAETLRRAGRTVVFCATGGQPAGLLAVEDPIKDSTRPALAALRADGIEVIMATGDAPATAAAVASELGIARVEAGVLPADKEALIRNLQSAGKRVAMAGDGINDAPALARADIGIAMGSGTDIAIESAHVTLLHGDLHGIARARHLSRATMRNIRQNLFFAFGYNALGVPLAAGALYPLFGWMLSPMIAAAAMTFSSVSVIANALRLRRA